jgi:hypothetical protein
MNSYYELLGLRPDATEMEIRSAYGRDVLRLQEMASDKVAQFRATLDAAFATLTDPVKRSAYDASLATAREDLAAEDPDATADAFRYARNGGLWFAGGGLVTAVTYAFSEGRYIIAWGPLLFGGFQLARGLLRYVSVPSGARKATHLMVLAGHIAVGALSAGFVALSESFGAEEAAAGIKWNAMIDATELEVMQANELVDGVASRPGPWDETDSANMEKASVLYAHVADAVAGATAPAVLEWYRAGMAKNFRDAATITHEYSLMKASESPSAFETLDKRWKARVEEANRLSDRFEAQVGPKP